MNPDIYTCKAILKRSNKFIKFHLVHGHDDILPVDGFPALIMRHGVCLWGGVEDKHTCSLRRTGKSVRSQAQSSRSLHYLCDRHFGFISNFAVCRQTITDKFWHHRGWQVEVLWSLCHHPPSRVLYYWTVEDIQSKISWSFNSVVCCVQCCY